MERITVTFEGEGAATGELTWGQQQVFQAMREMNSSMSMGGVVPVHDGRTVADFVEELRFFMTRYPSMRTLLRFTPDGRTTQETFASGEAYLEVHTAEDSAASTVTAPAVSSSSSSLVPVASVALPAAAESLAAEVFAAWKSRPFDYATEWPIRMAVVRSGPGGPVTHVLVEVTHIATDVTGLATMIRELSQRDALGPRPVPGPLDIAAQQRCATRQTDNAMRHWEAQLRTINPQRFPVGYRDPAAPRFRQVVWASRALHAASERLAARLAIDTAPVLLAAYAVAFTRVVGGAPFATQVIVGNRFRPGLAEVVSPLSQNGLVVLDPRAITAAEAVLRARQASMSASKYAYYDPQARQALLERVAKDRGEPIDLQVFYNERRLALRPPTTSADDETIRALRRETSLIRETELPYFNEKLMVNIDDVPDTIQITTEVDTAYLTVPRLHRLLAEMESFAVEAALNPQAPAIL
ncbi:hypothetical protein ACQP2P_12505 [Dactylosporangium sp. CA-139114]|uniref:hypothetical protein n=1 Tax=Dactylosporangium sp. CA-139114 TaxID=3239931 RepID=UPI003D9826CC